MQTHKRQHTRNTPWHTATANIFFIAPPLFSAPSFLGSGPKGADDLCFHTYGKLSPSPSASPSPSPVTSKPKFQPAAQIPALGLISKPQTPFPASWLQSQHQRSDPSLQAPISYTTQAKLKCDLKHCLKAKAY